MTIPIRPGESFDVTRVMAYLRSHLPEIPAGDAEVSQFGAGASNLTYLLRVGGWSAVLRRPPLGPVAPRAHDMEREAALLRLLHPVFALAPRSYLFCADVGILGAAFQLMEFRPGVVIDAALPPGVEPSGETGWALGRAAVETLAALHRVDYRAAGLDALAHPEGFVQRQLEGWIGRYERARTEEVPALEPLLAHLRAGVPTQGEAAVIHNDFKLNNLIFDPAALRVTGVVDWEMATVGDPLLDVAVFLAYWVDADDPPVLRNLLPTVTTLPGFPRRDQLRDLYAQASERELAGLDWYLTFAWFKLAVILQQIYARWVNGQTADPRFAGFGHAVRALLEHALAHAG